MHIIPISEPSPMHPSPFLLEHSPSDLSPNSIVLINFSIMLLLDLFLLFLCIFKSHIWDYLYLCFSFWLLLLSMLCSSFKPNTDLDKLIREGTLQSPLHTFSVFLRKLSEKEYFPCASMIRVCKVLLHFFLPFLSNPFKFFPVFKYVLRYYNKHYCYS